MSFKLGSVVREKITKAEGVVTCANVMIDGCILYAIQPASCVGKLPSNTFAQYEPGLELVKGSVKTIYKPTKLMGKKVRDKITGMEGTVVVHKFPLHHSEQVQIQPYGVDAKTGAIREPELFDLTRVELIEENVAKPIPREKPQVPNSTGPVKLAHVRSL